MSALQITQRVAADAGSQMQNVQQTVNLQQYLEIYFQMEVVGIGAGNGEFANFDFATPAMAILEPGKQYRVVVWTELNGQPGQRSVRVDSDLDLMLMLKGEKGVVYEVAIATPQVHLLEDDVKRFRHEFEMTVADELPQIKANLLLGYRPSKSGQKPRLATSQPVELAGTFNPPDEELLAKCNVALDMERPSQTAIIHVENVGAAGQVRLTCWGYYANRTLQTAPFTPPNVCLADFIEAQEDPLTVLGKLRTFSSDHPDLELIAWIDLLRKRLGQAMNLIIVDHTDTEIPWEMLELKDGVYLGAIVPVARWLPVPYYEKHIQMQVKLEKRIGHLMAYLDEQELPHAVKERLHLNHFMAHFQPSIQELYNSFKQSLAETGLVYLACHGIFASGTDLVAYGSWHNPSKRLVPLQLELLPYHESERPILFVNACHSARVKRHGQKLHGLPIVMLKRVASGYIGTLGPVNSEYASEFASIALTAIHDADEGVQPAELLRRLRAIAVQQLLTNERSQVNQLRFIYTFMYVYYGNPLTHLQLLPAAVRGEGDE